MSSAGETALPHPENATERQSPPDTGSEFTPLLRDVRSQELLDRRPGWYARTIAVNALCLAAVVTGMALVRVASARTAQKRCMCFGIGIDFENEGSVFARGVIARTAV